MSFIPPVITCDIGKRAYSLMLELVAIPSITGSDGGEEACAEFIFERLSKIDYFRRYPDDLRLIELKNDPLGRHSVGALLRASPSKNSKKTVILMGHSDVVDIDVCGPLREWAFEPGEYTARIGGLSLPDDVKSDLESGNYVFGRGVSDMKTGIALAMCLLEDYAAEERDFNLLLLVVPDEEADSAGMRGSISYLADLQEREKLDFVACICVEPSFDSGSPAVYFGSIGKIMPLYLCVGRESHVGSYYEGLNSALIASYLNISLEGGLDTAETFGGQTFPPQCCLRMRDTRDRYAVTMPERSVLYYNSLIVEKTPAAIFDEMKAKAMSALKAALSHVGHEGWEPRVLTVKEIIDKASLSVGQEALFSALPKQEMDERERNIEFISRALDIAGEKGPLVVVGFAPPFYPPRVNRNADTYEQAVRRAASVIGDSLKAKGFNLVEMEIFQGITDQSFTGFQGDAAELDLLKENIPLWGHGYDLPLEELRKIDIPCVVLGHIGKDAHKITERVELNYSFNVLPFALKEFMASLLK